MLAALTEFVFTVGVDGKICGKKMLQKKSNTFTGNENIFEIHLQLVKLFGIIVEIIGHSSGILRLVIGSAVLWE